MFTTTKGSYVALRAPRLGFFLFVALGAFAFVIAAVWSICENVDQQRLFARLRRVQSGCSPEAARVTLGEPRRVCRSREELRDFMRGTKNRYEDAVRAVDGPVFIYTAPDYVACLYFDRRPRLREIGASRRTSSCTSGSSARARWGGERQDEGRRR
jgi:hypothetical protein